MSTLSPVHNPRDCGVHRVRTYCVRDGLVPELQAALGILGSAGARGYVRPPGAVIPSADGPDRTMCHIPALLNRAGHLQYHVRLNDAGGRDAAHHQGQSRNQEVRRLRLHIWHSPLTCSPAGKSSSLLSSAAASSWYARFPQRGSQTSH